jgi:hypothetical protein
MTSAVPYPHLWLPCTLGVGLTVLPTPVIHDFCLPPRSAFNVVFEEAISCPVKASPAGGFARMFERGVHRKQEDSDRCSRGFLHLFLQMDFNRAMEQLPKMDKSHKMYVVPVTTKRDQHIEGSTARLSRQS